MFDDEYRRTERMLKINYSMGLLRNKDVFLFGASDNSRQIIQILRELGIEPKGVIDNDKKRQGGYCARIKVTSFDDISDPSDKRKVYIMYSAYWREMMPQLKKSGIKKRNIWRLNRRSGLIFLALLSAYKGKIYYNKIRKKYGDVPIFLCPYTGTGDIYLIGTFWDEYTKRNNLSEYAFVVISTACKRVADLFDIKNIEVAKKKKLVSYLISYYLYDPKGVKIKVLNDCWAQIHTNQVEWFRGYKGLCFTNLFRSFVFGLPGSVKPKHPQLKDERKRVDQLFVDHSILPARTVILSPYSNTLADLPDEFWEQMAELLKEKGYMVATNIGGKSEPPIKGTTALFFSLDIAPHVIEKAGAFIGVRSGFCDIISGTDAKKVILYDRDNRFYMGSAYEYFNLKDMELCDDATEIEYSHERIEELAENIAGLF